MKTIEQLFNDLEKPSVKWSGYFEVYERHFGKFRGKAPKVLEIGILGGGSIELWHRYFGKGTEVTGIDVNPDCLSYKFNGETNIVIGDQGDPEFWDRFLEQNTGFDIVIDDGGHMMHHQLTTLQKVFPHLKNDGVFLVEDTHTSYWDGWGGGNDKTDTFLHRSKQITDIMNQQHFKTPYISQEILNVFEGLYSVSFYNSVVVFEKRQLKPFIVKESPGKRS